MLTDEGGEQDSCCLEKFHKSTDNVSCVLRNNNTKL
jgi:hypothetical protein